MAAGGVSVYPARGVCPVRAVSPRRGILLLRSRKKGVTPCRRPRPVFPRNPSLLGFRRFWVSGVGKKRCQNSKMRFGGLFWTLFDDFLLFFLVLARRENIVIYTDFVPLARKKFFLQHAESCVNTSVFVRSGQKHCKYRDFRYQKQKTPQNHGFQPWLSFCFCAGVGVRNGPGASSPLCQTSN